MGTRVQLDAHSITRRQFTLGAVVAGTALAIPRLGAAIAASQADLAGLGLPTIDVTITADGYEGIPESLEAGRYLINATLAEGLEEGLAISFLKPFGISAEEFLGMFGPPPGAAEASPVSAAAVEGEEGGEEEEGPLPTFIYQSTFAGGTLAGPGTPGSAVVDLTEGEWLAWGDEPGTAQMPVIVTVTGEFPADAPMPEADITFTLIDFGIMAEGSLTAGDHLMLVQNQGAQPHFLELDMIPDGITNDDLAAVIEGFTSGTPAAVAFNPDTDFQPVTYTPTQSIGTMTWHMVSLEPGNYAATCWFPTAGIGDPHAFHGMHTVFQVS
jgi:hypothetical protein